MNDSAIISIVALPRFLKSFLAIIVDVALCTLAVWLAYYLRLGTFVSLTGTPSRAVLASVAVAIPMFILGGLYRAVLRHGGTEIMWSTFRLSAAYGVVYATIFTAYGIDGIPRTVGIIQPVLLFAMLFVSRATASYWLGGAFRKMALPTPNTRALIYGAGVSGRQLASAIADSGSMKVVAFLDDDQSLEGRTIAGLRVHSPEALNTLLSDLSVNLVLLAIPSATRSRRKEIIARLADTKVEVRTLPGIIDFAHGDVRIEDLRPLSLDDLLGRAPVAPAVERLASTFAERVVLITGAGGSIGGELARQTLALRPAKILLVETNEYALYSINRELCECGLGETEVIPLLGSVVDSGRMDEILATWRPDQIYHAAAFKHVPMVEHNVVDGVRNNTIGTLVLATSALNHGVENFVLVSTDKAVRPTNTMGASKRLAELILQGLATTTPSTCFSMVRFGNVLGSSGSVVPLFQEQILKGGPVTITHKEMTRYFMTIPEAAHLVMQAGTMAIGGEVFVLDMGEPVKIYDLATKMIELSGLSVQDEHERDGDIEVRSVGLRPGEKLYEELLIGNNPSATSHPLIMMAREEALSWRALRERLDEMINLLEARDACATRKLLLDLIAEFAPKDSLVDWVHLEQQSQLLSEH